MSSLLYRILSGIIKINVCDETYFIKSISVYQKYLVELYYEQLLQEYDELDNMMSQGQLFGWLIKNGYWKEENDGQLRKFKRDIEDFKVKLYECAFRTEEKKSIRNYIRQAESKYSGLLEQKHRFDYLTPEGAASIAKNKYQIALSIYKGENPLFAADSYFISQFPYLDHIILKYNEQLATSNQIREMARSDVWRKYWCGRESERVFGKSALELTDEQLNLISWTRIYDNVYQHPDCPGDEIIDDDDALDGFLIADKRKRDKEKGITAVDELITNEKIKNANEVFIVANTQEDAKKIYDLNEPMARGNIRKREKLIDKKGTVDEGELPDVLLTKQMEITRAASRISKS